eukprot:jgi/Botrbrau1/16256/Bobra.0066s0041.1
MGIFTSKHKGRRNVRSGLEITETDRAIADLKATKLKLGKEIERLEKARDKDSAVARELVSAKRKDRALLVLKMKKLREQQLDSAQKYFLNVLQVLQNIESAQMTNTLYTVLKEGKDAVASLQKVVTLDDVEQLMSDTATAKDYQEQMQQALSAGLTTEEDEDALQELDKLEQEVLQEDMAELPAPPEVVSAKVGEAELPEVPTHAVERPPEAAPQAEKRQEAPLLAA